MLILVIGSVFSTHVILIIIAHLMLVEVSFPEKRLLLMLLVIRHVVCSFDYFWALIEAELIKGRRITFFCPVVSDNTYFFTLADFEFFEVFVVVWIFIFLDFSSFAVRQRNYRLLITLFWPTFLNLLVCFFQIRVVIMITQRFWLENFWVHFLLLLVKIFIILFCLLYRSCYFRNFNFFWLPQVTTYDFSQILGLTLLDVLGRFRLLLFLSFDWAERLQITLI